MLRPMVSQPTHCHVWSTNGRYRGTRRLTVRDRRMLTAQGWTMTLVPAAGARLAVRVAAVTPLTPGAGVGP
jgi:hypothetical protein